MQAVCELRSRVSHIGDLYFLYETKVTDGRIPLGLLVLPGLYRIYYGIIILILKQLYSQP